MLNWWGIGSAYQDSPAIGWTLVTFVIFLLIIRHFVKTPLALFLKTRSQEIKTAIEEAKLTRLDAEAKLKQYEQRLLDLDAEILEMKSDSQHQGALEHARLQQEAEKIAAQIRKDSEQTLKAEVSRAILLLKQEIAEKILAKAKQNLNLTSELDARLCHTFVQQTSQEAK